MERHAAEGEAVQHGAGGGHRRQREPCGAFEAEAGVRVDEEPQRDCGDHGEEELEAPRAEPADEPGARAAGREGEVRSTEEQPPERDGDRGVHEKTSSGAFRAPGQERHDRLQRLRIDRLPLRERADAVVERGEERAQAGEPMRDERLRLPASAVLRERPLRIAHGGVQTHTYLAPTYGECQALLQQSMAEHDEDAPGHFGWGHPSTYTYQSCSLRSAFQLYAPEDTDEGPVTVTITIPARYSREVGELRRRYRYDEYLADYDRLFPAK